MMAHNGCAIEELTPLKKFVGDLEQCDEEASAPCVVGHGNGWKEALCSELRIELQQGFEKLSSELLQELRLFFLEDSSLAGPNIDFAGQAEKRGEADSSIIEEIDEEDKLGQASDGYKPWRGWMESMIEHNEKSMKTHMYDVFDHIKERNMSQRHGFNYTITRFVESQLFAMISMMLICANALWLGYECDNIFEHEEAWYRSVNMAFCTAFVIELLLKFIVLRQNFFFVDEWRWNVFDALVVLTSIPEYFGKSVNTSYLRVMRLAKLSRVFRLARLFKFFSAIHEILVTIFYTLGSLFWCLMALILVSYCFALCILQMIGSHVQEGGEFSLQTMWSFRSTWGTMLTLFSIITGGQDWYEIGRDFQDHSAYLAMYALLFYIFFMHFGLFNVITGVFCARANEASLESEELRLATEDSKRAKKVRDLLQIFKLIDVHHEGCLRWKQFQDFAHSSRGRVMLQSHGLQLFDLDKIWQAMDSYDGNSDSTVDKTSFVMGIMRLSGEGLSTSVFSLSCKVDIIYNEVRQSFARLEGAVRLPKRRPSRSISRVPENVEHDLDSASVRMRL